jgi:hypothetical protein
MARKSFSTASCSQMLGHKVLLTIKARRQTWKIVETQPYLERKKALAHGEHDPKYGYLLSHSHPLGERSVLHQQKVY